MEFREAKFEDRDFILNANREINVLSGLKDSTFENRIDNDLFKSKICKSIIAEIDGCIVGLLLYSYVYWANCGKGIYLSQAYVKKNIEVKVSTDKCLKNLKLRNLNATLLLTWLEQKIL